MSTAFRSHSSGWRQNMLASIYLRTRFSNTVIRPNLNRTYKLARAVLCRDLGHVAETGIGINSPKAYKSWFQLDEAPRYVLLQIFNFNDTVLLEGWRKLYIPFYIFFLFLCLFSWFRNIKVNCENCSKLVARVLGFERDFKKKNTRGMESDYLKTGEGMACKAVRPSKKNHMFLVSVCLIF